MFGDVDERARASSAAVAAVAIVAHETCRLEFQCAHAYWEGGNFVPGAQICRTTFEHRAPGREFCCCCCCCRARREVGTSCLLRPLGDAIPNSARQVAIGWDFSKLFGCLPNGVDYWREPPRSRPSLRTSTVAIGCWPLEAAQQRFCLL